MEQKAKKITFVNNQSPSPAPPPPPPAPSEADIRYVKDGFELHDKSKKRK